MEKVYLLHGVFFYEGTGLGIVNDPEMGERATVQKTYNYATFSGVVGSRTDGHPGLAGMMMDPFGESQITNFTFSDGLLSFTKQYWNRPPIKYKLKLTTRLWGSWYEGGYSGKDCEDGFAHCVVNVVDEEFFQPKELPAAYQ